MARDYKSDCGCVIHLIKWTAKANVLTVKHCPLHKAAPLLYAACKLAMEDWDMQEGCEARIACALAIKKAEEKI